MLKFKEFMTLYRSNLFFQRGVDEALNGELERSSKPFFWDDSSFALYCLGYTKAEMYREILDNE